MQQFHLRVIRRLIRRLRAAPYGNAFFAQGIVQGLHGKQGRIRHGGLNRKTRQVGGNGAVNFHFVLFGGAVYVGVIAFVFGVGRYKTVEVQLGNFRLGAGYFCAFGVKGLGREEDFK